MIGTSGARLAVVARFDVLVGNSRGPETLADLVAHVRAATVTRAGHQLLTLARPSDAPDRSAVPVPVDDPTTHVEHSPQPPSTPTRRSRRTSRKPR